MPHYLFTILLFDKLDKALYFALEMLEIFRVVDDPGRSFCLFVDGQLGGDAAQALLLTIAVALHKALKLDSRRCIDDDTLLDGVVAVFKKEGDIDEVRKAETVLLLALSLYLGFDLGVQVLLKQPLFLGIGEDELAKCGAIDPFGCDELLPEAFGDPLF